MPTEADALWTAFEALTRPVNRASVETCAEGLLSGKSLAGFKDWLDMNEAYLLGRLNG